MINLLAVIIGLFLALALARNKEFDKPQNKEMRNFLTFSVVILVLVGLGFLFPMFGSLPRSHSMLIFFLAGCAAITVSSSGQAKIFSRVAWVAILAFIIMGSFS